MTKELEVLLSDNNIDEIIMLMKLSDSASEILTVILSAIYAEGKVRGMREAMEVSK